VPLALLLVSNLISHRPPLSSTQFKYAFEALIVNDLSGVTIKSNGFTIMDNAAVMDYFGVKGIDRGRGVWCLWLFIVGFRFFFAYRLRTAFTGLRK